MRVVVCLKQVVDLASVRVSSRGELDRRDGVLVTNPADLCALEQALSLRDDHDAEVIALALGDADVEEALREALAMGAQRAIRLGDPAFAGSDAAAIAYALARAVATLDDCALVLTGARSSDDGGGQVGAHMAELLGWPQITSACGLQITEDRAMAVKHFEDGDQRISVPLPAVITVEERSNTPRLAHAACIMQAYEQPIVTWTANDIGAETARLGAPAALTVERRAFAPDVPAKGDILPGTPTQAVDALVVRLRRRGLI